MKLILVICLISMSMACGWRKATQINVHTETVPVPSNCNNPFLESLKSAGVKIHKHPLDDYSDTCKAEWSKYKNCCGTKSLISMYETDVKTSIQVNGKLEEVVQNINMAVHKMLELNQPATIKPAFPVTNVSRKLKALVATDTRPEVSTITAVPETQTKPSPGNSANAQANSNSPHQKMQLALLKVKNSKIHEEFKVSSEQCLTHMNKVRGASLCSICSGRGEVFFNKGKTLIEMQTCEDLVKSCSNFFNHVNDLIYDYRTLVSLSQADITDTASTASLSTLDDDLKKLSPPPLLLSYFKHHASTTNTTIQMFDATRICGMILNVREPTYFLKIAKILIDETKVSESPSGHNLFWANFKNDDLKNAFSKHAKAQIKPSIYGNFGQFFKFRGGKGNHFSSSGRYISNWIRSSNNRRLAISDGSDQQIESSRLAAPSDTGVSEQVFSSDSIVVARKSDNMFDSYDGAKGTSLDRFTSVTRTVPVDACKFP